MSARTKTGNRFAAWSRPTIEPTPHLPAVAKPVKLVRANPVGSTLDDYVARAERNGVAPAALQDLRLREALKQLGIHVYDYNTACRRIDAMAGQHGLQWYWAPLKWEHSEPCALSGHIHRHHGYGTEWRNGEITYRYGAYQRLVPDRALRIAERIKSVIPDVRFFVADYRVPRDPDPALLAMVPDGNPYVVDQWEVPDWGADAYTAPHRRSARLPARFWLVALAMAAAMALKIAFFH
jgi:hypothetical protein